MDYTAKAEKVVPRCPKCGFLMCELSDEREVGNMTIATPNGKFVCYGCERKRKLLREIEEGR